MDLREFRVLIKHYFIKGKSSQETKEKLDKHYRKSAPSIRTVILYYIRGEDRSFKRKG